MLPITFDISGTIEEFDFSQQESEELVSFMVKNLTAQIANKWDSEAKRVLKQTRDSYRASISIVDKGRFEGMIILRGQFPNMIEQGAEAWDMKEGFAKSSKAKVKKNGGWYFTVPFRLATPNALGESSVFSGVMPDEIYQLVKQKGANNPITKQDLGSNYTAGKREKIVLKSKTYDEYIHKSSIYVGLQKKSMTYQGATQSQYMNFRRVSDTSNPNAFIHPSMVARELAEKAIEKVNVPEQVSKMVDVYLDNRNM